MLDKMIQNPPANKLPPNLSLDRLSEVVARSGYPLQGLVARELQQSFVVTEEWGFPDRTTEEHRTLDVFAYKSLGEHKSGGDISISPALALLVECKRSSLPYVFFNGIMNSPPRGFPTVTRLRSITLQAGNRSQNIPASRALGLQIEPFVASGPPLCSSFAHVAGRGGEKEKKSVTESEVPPNSGNTKGIELSGSDAYNNILLPLISAMEHLDDFSQFDKQLFPMLTLAVCLLDAPMLLAQGVPEQPTLDFVPWVRVVRQETKGPKHDRRTMHHVVDFIHRGALADFVEQVLRFSLVFSKRCLDLGGTLSKRQARVADLESWEWSDLKA